MCSLGDLCSLVITNVRIQGGHQHQRLIQKFIYLFTINCNSIHTFVREGNATVPEKPSEEPTGYELQLNNRCLKVRIPDGPKDIGNHHRFKNVQLKMTIGATNCDCHVIAHYLGCNHGDGFALGGVNLTRHNRAAWFVFWQ